MSKEPTINRPKEPGLLGLLKPYTLLIVSLVIFAIFSNALSLALPKIIADGIDDYTHNTLVLQTIIFQFFAVTLGIFLFTYLQNILQTYASERVAKDLRENLSDTISRQSYAYIQEVSSAKLLTNLTSDVDAVKTFISQAIVSIISSIFLIVGASTLLLLINWRLALAVLAILPLIAGTFFAIFRKVRVLFRRGQEVIDWLNKVINESILGAALIRVLYSQTYESAKFTDANTDALGVGLQILRLFSTLIPVVTFLGSMATLIILLFGGHLVITGSLTLGDLAAFNGYLSILIFPIFIIGFMSNVIARASTSYGRIAEVLQTQPRAETGTINTELRGDIDVQNVSLIFGEKSALQNVSFSVKAGSKTAIIGPTAAGKTQLLHVLTGLVQPTKGTVTYDGKPIDAYDSEAFHRQVGLVFQDSVLFNLTLRENIAFSNTVDDSALEKAIRTAELQDFVEALPQKLDTVVSERGTSLSGGQKQRIMLARALSLNPRVLLLDDFTARIDAQTERSILRNVQQNYPDITLVSITQKIGSIEEYDNIIVLMEGEVLAQGTHEELMHTSPEYVQIVDSQRSTNTYE
ncbi:MAG: transporter [Candidatus Peribacteria bacterium]|nr:transporter [Candidatus Peribacteria bacterium]